MILLAGEGEANQRQEDECNPAWDTGEHPEDYVDGFPVWRERVCTERKTP